MKIISFFGAAFMALSLTISAYASTSLSKISCQHSVFTGGGTDACSVYMTGNVSNTDVIALSSNNPNAILSSSSIHVSGGHQSGSFSINVASVTKAQTAIITATFGGKSVTYGIALNAIPSAPTSDTLGAINCQSSSFTSQGTDSCTANLTAAATTNDSINLTSSNSSAVPTASVQIATGNTTAGFSIAVATVTTQQTVTITATLGSSVVRYSLTLYPPSTPVQHKVTLNWNAPQPNGDTIAGYHIYRSAGSNTTNFTEISSQSTTSFIDTNVTSGSSYTYVVRAVDTNGVESSNSNTTVAAIPTP